MQKNNADKVLAKLAQQWQRPQSAKHWVNDAHQKLGQTMLAWTKDNFDSQGGLLKGSNWPARASGRSRADNSRPLLVKTGRLKESFRLFSSSKEVRASNIAPYAAHHHFGQGVPKRAIFPEVAQAEKLLMPSLRKLLPNLPFIPKSIF